MEQRLISIIEGFRGRMPDDFLDEVIGLASHREWGVALENLCTQLYEHDIFPSDDELEKIKRINACMGLTEKTWSFLDVKHSST